jgi:hypothetical protein
MTCANHPEAEVSAYCRSCGKALCVECKKEAAGTIFCAEHAPAAEKPADPIPPPPPAASVPESSPYNAPYVASPLPPPPGGTPYSSAPPPRGTPYVHPSPSGLPNPAFAFLLGFIPGVGAIYNGQYAKGLIHAVVFGLLVTMLNSGHIGNFEPLFGIFLAVWIFYMAFEAHHTASKRRSGQTVDELSSLMNIPATAGGVPVGPVILIGLGVLLLLNTLDLISFDRIVKYWPVLLIAGGIYLLYARLDGRAANHERR